MKLPWDKNYFKIVLYAVLTFVSCYVLKLVIDGTAYLLVGFGDFIRYIGSFFSSIVSVFSPLVIGLVIAYILDPPVGFLQKYYNAFHENRILPILTKLGMHRTRAKKMLTYKKRIAGSVLMYMMIVAVITLASFLLYKKIMNIDSLIDKISSAVNSFSEKYAELHINIADWGVFRFVSEYLTFFVTGLTLFIQSIINGIANGSASAGSGILKFLLGTVIAFYLLKDKEQLLAKASEIIDIIFPARSNLVLRNALSDMHFIFSGYIRGQLTDACIMAVLISSFLIMLNVDFAVVIGIVSGFSNLIPYFGAITGFVLSVTVALIGGDPMKAVYAALGIIILQQIDGIYINPKIIGKSVELGPVLVLLSLTVGGQLFGFIGLILAVPICAILKIFISRLIERRKAAVLADDHI